MVRPCLVLAGALLLSGCTVEIPGTGVGSDDDDGDSSGSGGGGTGSTSDPAGGKLSSNGLQLDLTALMLLEPTAIGHWESETVAVADSGSLDRLLGHPAGADHLEYLALCALDQGTELVAADNHYPGLFGLGREWVDAGCGDSCQRWISACVLAHANAYGIPVTVSLRGGNAGLVWDQSISDEFTLQEAAFYGNVFAVTGIDYPVQPLYACAGRALIAFDDDETHEDTSHDYLMKRICGTGDCGLNNTGPCVYPPLESESTCGQDAGWEGYYGNCEGEDLADPLEPPPIYPEVITTYLVDE